MRIFTYLLIGSLFGAFIAGLFRRVTTGTWLPVTPSPVVLRAEPLMTPQQLRQEPPVVGPYVNRPPSINVQEEEDPKHAPSGFAWVSDDRPEHPLWVNGRGYGRGRFFVWLSDGRLLREGDAGLARIDERGIVLADGRRVWMRPIGTRDEGDQGSQERTLDLTGRPGSAGDDLPDSPTS